MVIFQTGNFNEKMIVLNHHCLSNLKMFEHVPVSFIKNNKMPGINGLIRISENIIMRKAEKESEFKELKVSNFKVWQLEDNKYKYEMNMGEEIITTNHNFVEKLSNSLCHITKNEFYFKIEGVNAFGKITLDEKTSKIKIENFKTEQTKEFENDSFSLRYYEDRTTSLKMDDFTLNMSEYFVYTDPTCRELLSSARDKMTFCDGFIHSVLNIGQHNINDLTHIYGPPVDKPAEEGSFKHLLNFFKQRGVFRDENYTILNYSFDESNMYLVQLISNIPDAEENFTVIKIWFSFDDVNNKNNCQKKFVHYISKQECGKQFYIASEIPDMPKGLVTFKKEMNGKGIMSIDQKTYRYDKLQFMDVKGKTYKKMTLYLEGGKALGPFSIIIPQLCNDYISELTNNVKQFRRRNFIR
jgi:hypothetical protein